MKLQHVFLVCCLGASTIAFAAERLTDHDTGNAPAAKLEKKLKEKGAPAVKAKKKTATSTTKKKSPKFKPGKELQQKL
jgi:hypothetical protein